jgi:hypothetical protein
MAGYGDGTAEEQRSFFVAWLVKQAMECKGGDDSDALKLFRLCYSLVRKRHYRGFSDDQFRNDVLMSLRTQGAEWYEVLVDPTCSAVLRFLDVDVNAELAAASSLVR